MNKIKMAICMSDLEYQVRFVNCFMNHYNHQYELHVFTNKSQLLQAKPKEYAVIITGEYITEEMTEFVEKGEILIGLVEDIRPYNSDVLEKIVYIQKYQEVFRIAEKMERLLVDKNILCRHEDKEDSHRCVGIYSLTQERYQAPFAALLGNIIGEKQKVLILDLQPYSGLCTMEEGMTFMGLEDLLSSITTGNYSKSRILECIRHEVNWDYICVSDNMECLAEGSKELYDTLINLLAKEFGYQMILISFGALFPGQMEMLGECQTIYLLCENECMESWREAVFSRRIMCQEKKKLMQRIRKIQIPTTVSKEKTWKALVEKWCWGYMGELLRQEIKEEMTYGAVV